MTKGIGALLIAVLIGLIGSAGINAQDTTAVSSANCAPVLEAIWTAASDACIGGPVGFFCNGGAAPQVEPAGAVSNALSPIGSLVEVGVVQAIRTSSVSAEGGTGGLVWLRPDAPVRYTGLMIGNVTIWNITPPDFPAWQSTIVQTGSNVSSCGAVPRSAYIIQAPFGQPANIAINGVSVTLGGTLLIQTEGDSATIFSSLSGVSGIYAAGQQQVVRPGQEVIVSYSPGNLGAPIAPPAPPQPLDQALVFNLPVALLDRPIILPQPGFVQTDGAVNLRVAPSTDAGVIVQVPPGQILSVLGRNPNGDWYHVRLDSGETGWMFANLLTQNLGTISAVYEATPLPPQRYGDLGRVATVVAPAGVNMRNAPDVAFGVVTLVPDGAKVTLLARSPYSPWVKVDFNGVQGWLALITLQTQSVIDALPIDYNVPPQPAPPEPTTPPGSFGNAFPDPNRDG